MPLKKSVRARRSPRLKKTRWMKVERMVRANASVIVPLAAICVLGVAMLIAEQQPSPADMVGRTTQDRSAADALAKSVAPVTDPEPARPTTPSSLTEAEPQEARVTITGCLEQADELFRLKDTRGTDAPKARNWRWGFLKKGPASVQVVDGATSVRLRDHVGQRVIVTGLLVDRAMQVRSLQRVSSSCSSPARVKI